MIRRALAVAGAALVLAAGPAEAQLGVLDRPFRNDPFQPLLVGGWSFTQFFDVGASNNTLGIGDMVALSYVADDFRPSDAFLVAGLVPAGEGVRLGTHARTGVTVGFPAGSNVTLGVVTGVRVLGFAGIPDEVAALVRDGITGDEITVELTDVGGEVFGYGEAGLSSVVELPVLPTPYGTLRLLVGGGARYIHGISHVRLGLGGDTGADTSTFTLNRSGVSTTLNMTAPLGQEILSDGGSGLAVDLMVGALVRGMGQLRLAVTDLGGAKVSVGRREITTITMDEVSFVELGTAVDSGTVTDTVAGLTREVSLPTTLRVDASYRPVEVVGVGARLAVPLEGDAAALEPLAQLGVELRPIRALPLRFGVHGGGAFGVGFFSGLAVDTRAFDFDIEVAAEGGPVLADIRGLALRTGLAIRF